MLTIYSSRSELCTCRNTLNLLKVCSFLQQELFSANLPRTKTFFCFYSVLSSGLKSNFAEVNVEEVECPDLREAPFNLAGEGLSGQVTILEVGSATHMYPMPDKSKMYDMAAIYRKILPNVDDIIGLGVGAGPHTVINSNCEGIFNATVHRDGSITNQGYIARVRPGDEECELLRVPKTEKKCSLLANVFISEGKPGKVLRVHCKRRIGSADFIASVRKTLAAKYPNQLVGKSPAITSVARSILNGYEIICRFGRRSFDQKRLGQTCSHAGLLRDTHRNRRTAAKLVKVL